MDIAKGHPGGRLLAHYRNQRDMGQHDLAEMAHCSRSMIAQIEAGARLPSGELLTAMSDALNLNTVERAMLFYLYDKVESGQISMLPYVIAAIRADSRLQANQVEALVDLATQAYQEVLTQNRERATQ
jgi:transcriptional regulator with XRE-family HTH domain